VKWLLKVLGIQNSVERKKKKLAALRQKAFEAQRNGDLRLAGKYLSEAEMLETEIIDDAKVNDENR